MKLIRNKLFLFTVILVLAAIITMVIAFAGGGQNTPLGRAIGAVVTPLEDGVARVSDWLSGLFGYFYRYSALEEENQLLKARLAEYMQLETEYWAAVNENEELRRLARLQQKHKDFDSEMCAVISYDGTGFQSSFTINRGSTSGIEVGDPVVVTEGLVGYVSAVGPNYANVVTLLNQDSKVSAVISRTRETVVAEGDFQLSAQGYIKLSYLRNDADIKVGDWIETSGSGGNYPNGLLIGKVVEFGLEKQGISSYAMVQPVTDLSSLTGVFVVKDFMISN